MRGPCFHRWGIYCLKVSQTIAHVFRCQSGRQQYVRNNVKYIYMSTKFHCYFWCPYVVHCANPQLFLEMKQTEVDPDADMDQCGYGRSRLRKWGKWKWMMQGWSSQRNGCWNEWEKWVKAGRRQQSVVGWRTGKQAGRLMGSGPWVLGPISRQGLSLSYHLSEFNDLAMIYCRLMNRWPR